ncbi:MAG: WYL domain-containing protein [Candidatus Paceibacterota bacterium]
MGVHVLETLLRKKPNSVQNGNSVQNKRHAPAEAIVIRDRSKELKVEQAKVESQEQEKKEQQSPSLDVVRKSMEEIKMLTFSYESHGDKKIRKVEPYKLMRNNKGEIILYAYCVESNGIRAFKIDKIVECAAVEETFMPRWPVENQLDPKPDPDKK